MTPSQTLRGEFQSFVAQTSPNPLMVEVERAEGIYLYSPDSKRYTDLVSGVSVSNVGHSNPRVIEAIVSQSQRYLHTMVYGETVMRPQVEYARLIGDLTTNRLSQTSVQSDIEKSSEAKSVYFVSSGSESIELAMKIAKRATHRGEIISMRDAYHGSTQGALSLQSDPYFKSAFHPLLPQCSSIEFNNTDDLQHITPSTACVITEIVQGEAGVILPKKGYLSSLAARCKEVGALLIVDEIQTGFGRCGSMFAYQEEQIEPDLICLAKALGGGMPLGGVVGRASLMQVLQSNPVLGHITTFGGNPVCAAAGMAACNFIIDNNLTQNATEMGDLFHSLLAGELEMRGRGLLLAVELHSSEKMHKVVEALLKDGVMTDWFLFNDTSIRISPPLTINADEVKEVCSQILRAVAPR